MRKMRKDNVGAGLPLQNSDALFGALIENAFDTIIVMDVEGEYLVCQFVGYSRARLPPRGD